MSEIKPPDLERFIGIEVYKSKTDGIGGRIKQIPEDFIVEEINPEGKILEVGKFEDLASEQISGEYTHFTLQKRNWDNILAIKEISKRLGISYKRFGFAGTKDKRALTTQRVSVWNVSEENLKKVNISDITIGNFGYMDDGVNLGDLWGNRFTITIRNLELEREILEERIKAIIQELASGVPNFFGVQRFGTTRPITHLVGKEILKGKFENAVIIYLAKGFEEESKETREAREFIGKTHDFKEGLKIFPKYLSYELAIMNHLVKKPTDFVGALRKLPKKLRWMFVHAYQGFIFNKALSEYISQGIIVEKLPLVGYETGIDEITKEILDDEKITMEDFKISAMPELSSKGIYRDCFAEARDFNTKLKESRSYDFALQNHIKIMDIMDDELNPEKKKIILQFSLSKGNYATTVIREFMKNKYW